MIRVVLASCGGVIAAIVLALAIALGAAHVILGPLPPLDDPSPSPRTTLIPPVETTPERTP